MIPSSREGMLSFPHRVIFQGFESTTTRLQQHGWQLSAEQDIMKGSLQLALHLPSCGLYMIADQMDYDKIYGRPLHEPLNFMVRRATSKMTIIQSDVNINGFNPIDAMPQTIDMTGRDISTYDIFAKTMVRTQEIYVEPASVQECLELIRKIQAPSLQKIRETNRVRDYMEDREVRPRQKFHAQIVSTM
jgi:hypothetical protein